MSDQEMGVVGEAGERVDFEEVMRSINGFDEIAVSQYFGRRPAKMEDTEAARAVLFVALRRRKMNDKAAFKYVMEVGLSALEDHFLMPDAAGVVSESEQAERDQEYAQFLVVTGLAFTPDQFLGLTAGQKQAIYDEVATRRR